MATATTHTADECKIADQTTQDHRFKRVYTYDDGGEYPETSWDDLVLSPSDPTRRIIICQIDVQTNEVAVQRLEISCPTKGTTIARQLPSALVTGQVQCWYLYIGSPGEAVTIHFSLDDGSDPDYAEIRVGLREI